MNQFQGKELEFESLSSSKKIEREKLLSNEYSSLNIENETREKETHAIMTGEELAMDHIETLEDHLQSQ